MPAHVCVWSPWSRDNGQVGSRVRIERDETRYPPKGTWGPQFRGKTGTVVEINDDEFGVVFGKVRKPRANGSIAMAEAVWFKAYELSALASQGRVACLNVIPPMDDTREPVNA